MVEVTQLVSGRIGTGQSQVYVLYCRSSSGSRKPAHLLEISHPGQRVAVMTDTCSEGMRRGGEGLLSLFSVMLIGIHLTEGQTPVTPRL